MSILKCLTKNLFVQNTQLDRLRETLLIQVKGATEVEMLDERHVKTMTNHLGTENTHVKLGIMCNHRLSARTDEPHEIQKNLSEGATLSLSLLLSDAMNGNRTLTNLKVVGVNDRIERVDETTT
jgi:hypothetical protein